MSGLQRWATSLAIVLLAHAVLIATAWWWASRTPPVVAAAPPAALMLELAPAAQAPPVPRQQERIKAPVLPQGELAAPAEPPAEPAEDAADSNSDRTLAPPDVPAQAAASYAAPRTTAGERSSANATWQGVLLGHLQQHRRYPRQSERLRQQGVAYVRFAVARDGRVSAPRIERSSGFALLDQETLDTVQRASPVPAPPADVAGDPVEVMVPVAFFLRGR